MVDVAAASSCRNVLAYSFRALGKAPTGPGSYGPADVPATGTSRDGNRNSGNLGGRRAYVARNCGLGRAGLIAHAAGRISRECLRRTDADVHCRKASALSDTANADTDRLPPLHDGRVSG